MKVVAIKLSNYAAKNNKIEFEKNRTNENYTNQTDLQSTPLRIALAQMPNVSFKGLSENDKMEIKKSELTRLAEIALRNGEKLKALKIKTDIAKICKQQGKNYNVFLLEDGMRDIYRDLPSSKRDRAAGIIKEYNTEMADNIERDIQEMEIRRQEYERTKLYDEYEDCVNGSLGADASTYTPDSDPVSYNPCSGTYTDKRTGSVTPYRPH